MKGFNGWRVIESANNLSVNEYNYCNNESIFIVFFYAADICSEEAATSLINMWD